MTKDSEYEIFWCRLNKKKAVTGDVVMTKDQFKNMMRQAFNHGFNAGHDSGIKSAEELRKITNRNKPFSSFFN